MKDNQYFVNLEQKAAKLGFLASYLLLSTSWSAFAQESRSISHSKLEQIQPERSSAKGSCVSFEATFSRPLQSHPKATLEIEKSERMLGVASQALEVINLAPNRYRLAMRGDAPDCALLREKGTQVSVILDGAQGADGLPVLTDQRNFRVGKNFRAK